MFSFWKKKQPLAASSAVTRPQIYPLVKAKKNILSKQEEKKQQALDFLISTFNNAMEESTKKGWHWADFATLNTDLGHDAVVDLLQKEGYTVTWQTKKGERSFDVEHKYSVRMTTL